MGDFTSLLAHHGYALLGLVCFLEAIGLPMPAALALLTAGAFCAYGNFHPMMAFAIAALGIISGDLVLFLVGRYTGWGLLGLLCTLSASPETCILRSAESFYKRGRITLVFAKFIPGINTMAPPLAGSMKMRFEQFLYLDILGACLYVLAYGSAGFLFSDFLRTITHGLRSAGHAAEIVLSVGACVFILYRVWLYRKFRLYKGVPRVPVEEVVRRLAAQNGEDVVLMDVRSHGYYDAESSRIAGSIRLEPNNLAEEIKRLPRDKDVYIYCT